MVIAYACPWANRTNAMRVLKGLDGMVGVTVVDPVMRKTRPEDQSDKHSGWWFRQPFMGSKTVREFYEKYSPQGAESQKYSVPILFDTKTNEIVNNESAEIIRMFNSEFNELVSKEHAEMDFYKAAFRQEIDDANSWVYPMINNGVYRAGFATSQDAYDEAVNEVFNGLDRVEAILSKQRYITSSPAITEADIRLFMTLVRFDEVYHQHFKCNKKRIADYPNMENYVRELYQIPGIRLTINMKEIKEHYFMSHPTINRYGIIAAGPGVQYDTPHDRESKFPLA